ncbi:MAG: leucine-rich repeat domain-containing protein [Raoultibacter sp.]
MEVKKTKMVSKSFIAALVAVVVLAFLAGSLQVALAMGDARGIAPQNPEESLPVHIASVPEGGVDLSVPRMLALPAFSSFSVEPAGAAAPVAPAAAEEAVAITPANFPDALFRAEVEGFDTSGDKSLQPAERRAVDSIGRFNVTSNVQNFKGIEYFDALETFIYEGNNITADLKLDLSHNTNLRYISLVNTQVTQLSIPSLPKLEKLYCSNNKLVKLTFADLPKLKRLDCGNNELAELNVSSLPALENLVCSDNRLTTLDLSANKLKFVNLEQGQNAQKRRSVHLPLQDAHFVLDMKGIVGAENVGRVRNVQSNTGAADYDAATGLAKWSAAPSQITYDYNYLNSAANVKAKMTVTLDALVGENYHTVMATAGENGLITPSGATPVVKGGSITFKFTPNVGYAVDTVTVNNALVTPINDAFTIDDVRTNDLAIHVTFKALPIIVATSQGHGSITPSGTFSVEEGSSPKFTLIPEGGYEVDIVIVNGVEVTPVNNTVTLDPVRANTTTTVNVLFSAISSARKYNVAATAGLGGDISPAGNVEVARGGSQSFRFEPKTGYELDAVTVNGAPVVTTNNTYTLADVRANASIHATFKLAPAVAQKYLIAATAGAGGAIDPAGTSEVDAGASWTYVFTPQPGYVLDTVSVDGAAVTPTNSTYTFVGVEANRAIHVTFKKIPAGGGDGGSGGGGTGDGGGGNTTIVVPGTNTVTNNTVTERVTVVNVPAAPATAAAPQVAPAPPTVAATPVASEVAPVPAPAATDAAASPKLENPALGAQSQSLDTNNILLVVLLLTSWVFGTFAVFFARKRARIRDAATRIN